MYILINKQRIIISKLLNHCYYCIYTNFNLKIINRPCFNEFSENVKIDSY